MNNLSKRPSRTEAVSIVPSDRRIQEKQAELLAALRGQVRNLKIGITERDTAIAERDERIAELESKLNHANEERGLQ